MPMPVASLSYFGSSELRRTGRWGARLSSSCGVMLLSGVTSRAPSKRSGRFSEEASFPLVWIRAKAFDPASVERARWSDEAVNLGAPFQQEVCQV